MFWWKSKINDIPIGITWGKNDLLVVELKRNKHGFLAETAKIPIAKGLFNGEGDLEDGECLISSLRVLKEERGWYRKKVVTAFPGRKAPLRYFRVPDMPSKELKLAVEWEAKQLFGFTKKEYCFDYVILTEKNRETPTSKGVLLAAIPKEFALKLYQTFLEGGFILEAIDVAPIAFARALNNNAPSIEEEEGNATLFLDLGTCFTQLVFFSNQQVIFARTIGFIYLNTFSSGDELANEIKRTLSYLKTNAREIQLKEIVAGGVGSDWQGLNQLESALAIPIKKGIPGLGYLEKPYPENIYTTALGLALKGVVGNVY